MIDTLLVDLLNSPNPEPIGSNSLLGGGGGINTRYHRQNTSEPSVPGVAKRKRKYPYELVRRHTLAMICCTAFRA